MQDALRVAMSIAHLGNRYLNDKEPWKTIKTDNEKTSNTLYVAALIVKKLAIIMEPFIPFTAEKIWNLLNLSGSVQSQLWVEINNDFPLNHKINKAKPLFKKIIESEEELQTKLENFRNTVRTE